MKIIGLASDHNGIEIKEKMRLYLKKLGYITIDIGPWKTSAKVDYVDYANQISQMITNSDLDCGILICGTGVGMSIAANRFEKIRAALVHNIDTAPKCREHNDSNVLCLGSWTTSQEENFDILNLQTNILKQIKNISQVFNLILKREIISKARCKFIRICGIYLKLFL